MENPEKIYLASFDENPEVLDRTWYWEKQYGCYNTEYIRKDALIEKACKGIEHLLSGYVIMNFHFGDSYEIDTLINDLKKYMEGE